MGVVLKACHEVGAAAAAAAAAATPAAMASSFESRLASERAATAGAIADRDGYKARVETLTVQLNAALDQVRHLVPCGGGIDTHVLLVAPRQVALHRSAAIEALARRTDGRVARIGDGVEAVHDAVTAAAAPPPPQPPPAW